MSNIKEYYQPLYDAIEEYKKIHEKWESLDSVYRYLNGEVSKTKGKKKKTKGFRKYLKMAKKKRKETWEEILMLNVKCFLIWFFVMVFFGALAVLSPFVTAVSIFLYAVLVIYANKHFLPEALEREKELNRLVKFQEEREEVNKQDVDKTLDDLRWEMFQLRQKEHSLESYIEECAKKLIEENMSLVNEILESYGINAEIDVDNSEVNLTKLEIKKLKK